MNLKWLNWKWLGFSAIFSAIISSIIGAVLRIYYGGFTPTYTAIKTFYFHLSDSSILLLSFTLFFVFMVSFYCIIWFFKKEVFPPK